MNKFICSKSEISGLTMFSISIMIIWLIMMYDSASVNHSTLNKYKSGIKIKLIHD